MFTDEIWRKLGVGRERVSRALVKMKDEYVVQTYIGNRPAWDLLSRVRGVKISSLPDQSRLDHSRKLIPGLRRLCRDYRIKDFTRGEGDSLTYVGYARQHIDRGYPEIDEICESTGEAEIELQKEEGKFLKRTEKKFESLPGMVPKDLAKAILHDINCSLSKREPYFLSNLRVEGAYVKSGRYTLARAESMDQLKQLFEHEEASSNNRKRVRRILKLASSYSKVRSELEKKIVRLVLQIDNGKPLGGACDLCSQ